MTWQNQQSDCAPSEDSDRLGIRPVWSEFSLSAWRNVGSLANHWAHSEDSVQLILVFAGRTLILLVLSCRGSIIILLYTCYWKYGSCACMRKNNPQASAYCITMHLHLVHYENSNVKHWHNVIRCICRSEALHVDRHILIRKMSTLKPVHLALWNFTYFVASTKLKNAENLNLISWIVPEL